MSRDPVFYTLPAEDIREGMSTVDGQEVLSVTTTGTGVLVEVYTPNDDQDIDSAHRGNAETRLYEPGQRVNLAVFDGTVVDGSTTPNAQPGMGGRG